MRDITRDDVVNGSRAVSALRRPIIFFLLQGKKVVYVGQSMTGPGVILHHQADKKFDRYYYAPCPEVLLDALERRYIKRLAPFYNCKPAPKRVQDPALARHVFEQHTVKETAKILKLTTKTILRWVRSGRIASSRPSPRLILIPRREIIRILSQKAADADL